jgi:hypothetical protein
MVKTVISGDIIASTSLTDSERVFIEKSLKVLLLDLRKYFNSYGHLIKGDYIDCVVEDPAETLRAALAIKSYVKSLRLDNPVKGTENNRFRKYRTYRIRLAIGYGELSRYNPAKDIIDGEAIYLSGRTISQMETYTKERIVIKNTLFFASKNDKLNNGFEALFSLLDVLLSKATSKQSEVLYLKLLGFNENQISKKMKISQQTVNKHSRSVGWIAIEKAVEHFRTVIKDS